jgi:hypothetical protein
MYLLWLHARDRALWFSLKQSVRRQTRWWVELDICVNLFDMQVSILETYYRYSTIFDPISLPRNFL